MLLKGMSLKDAIIRCFEADISMLNFSPSYRLWLINASPGRAKAELSVWGLCSGPSRLRIAKAWLSDKTSGAPVSTAAGLGGKAGGTDHAGTTSPATLAGRDFRRFRP